jgi:hypothetical protein
MSEHPNIIIERLAQEWQQSHFSSLNKVHLTYADIAPIITQFSQQPKLTHQIAGHSYNGCPIHHFTYGHGPIVILAWTQMHGDEATATAAVLDWLTLLLSEKNIGLGQDWQDKVTLHIVPMLNPDGAQAVTRINAQGIDINRDAQSLQSPEGRLLQRLATELSPHVAFNLHDQNPYYTVGKSKHTATISFLAPAYHQDKHVDAARLRAKQLIATMAQSIRHWLPQHIGRYDDTYSLRSFGDNIAALGASTILIESGAYANDPHRQMARKMNVVGLHSALLALLSNTHENYSLADYYAIPENHDDGLIDVKISNLQQKFADKTEFHADIGITFNKAKEASIDAIGDLSVQAGFVEFDATGYQRLPMKGYPIDTQLELDDASYRALLSQGYSYFIGSADKIINTSELGILVLPQPHAENSPLLPKQAAFWLMQKDDQLMAVLNGQLLPL